MTRQNIRLIAFALAAFVSIAPFSSTVYPVAPTLSETWSTELNIPYSVQDHIRMDDVNVYFESFLGECNRHNIENCVRYALYGVVKQFEVIERPFTYFELLAMTYYGELSYFHLVGRESAAVSYEAITRSFFDAQSGACIYDSLSSVITCEYDDIIRWMATMQYWRDAAVQVDEDTIRVNTRRLFGMSYLDIPYTDTAGYLGFDDRLYSSLQDNIHIWHTGQGYSVPSSWGATVVSSPDDAAHYINNDGVLSSAVFYVYPGGMSVNEQPGLDNNGHLCILVALITTQGSRLTRDELSTCN